MYKPPPLTASLNVPGISPFYTPNTDFYRVDTSLVIPQLQSSTWQLKIHGMVDKPMTITFDELMKMPMVEHDITLTCVSEAVGGGYVGNARWQGTLLADILRKAGIQSGAEQIVMRDVKGMTIGVATEPVMDGRKSMLAVGMNGQLLPQAHGFPVRVVVPGLYGYVSATKWVVDMEFTTFGAFDAYWVKQGWSQQGPIKTESRIDVPKAAQHRTAGQVTIAGVAWAQHVGIEAVEVGVDGVWYRRSSPRRTPSTPGASGTTSGTPPPACTCSRCGPPTRPATPRPRWCRRPSRTARPATTPSRSPSPEPADGAHPLCAPSACPAPAGRRLPPPRGGQRGTQHGKQAGQREHAAATSPSGQRERRALSRSSRASRLWALTTASQ